MAREAYMYIALAFHFRPYTSGSKICFCLVFSLMIRVLRDQSSNSGRQRRGRRICILLQFHYRPYTSGSKICFCMEQALIIRLYETQILAAASQVFQCMCSVYVCDGWWNITYGDSGVFVGLFQCIMATRTNCSSERDTWLIRHRSFWLF